MFMLITWFQIVGAFREHIPSTRHIVMTTYFPTLITECTRSFVSKNLDYRLTKALFVFIVSGRSSMETVFLCSCAVIETEWADKYWYYLDH